MPLQRVQFILCIIILTLLPKCYAPPVSQDNNIYTSKLAVVSILRTILLGYMTHIATIRHVAGITIATTPTRLFFALAYPSSGIGTAVGSIHSAFYGDEILGITQYMSILKEYEKEDNVSDANKKESHHQDQVKTISQDSLILTKVYTLDSEEEKYDATKKTLSEKRRIKVVRLRDRLVKDAKTEDIDIDIKKGNNAPYLAAFLHVMGPEKARKIKHCILNDSITIGFNDTNRPGNNGYDCDTEEITITGPGLGCDKQRRVYPSDIRYMTTNMIDQLEGAYNVDDTSYIEIFVTIGQLFFTTVECMDIDGDRWAKVIIIIYTTMSVLQSVSLLALHKQTMAFSIKVDEVEEKSCAEDSKISTETDHRLPSETEDFRNHGAEIVVGLSNILGIIIFLLIGIWADYSIHSTTEWLVISWILSPVILSIAVKLVEILFHCTFDGSNSLVYAISSIPIVCLIAATIIGYLPK
ncbi:hypothetical protein J3Q64DRAFT_1697583 [Phycomyces blakesleeanus]|uniref:Uncharacterized protein n=2 Tax=Phycomyces blakesleeanus TaxID=4837 RepID=A0A167NF28_PHYB8|nr:hypothetical protein PHYBLDRAFT_59286 [Phycomyces blakesleeanus NRRL 1555(-)]OAD75750.1 hypothetical protein PHYBLDRAFT_59286 [Phycomyces blakesleeanus NRRL 1555(-)]|eukprot:XP_018293790.1 hypothetical protein PHYBLDRAFT_59286 [Phycomyces blakesleeanus NRRL 1555(-)]